MLTIESINTILEDKEVKITVYSDLYEVHTDYEEIIDVLEHNKALYLSMDVMVDDPDEMAGLLISVEHCEKLKKEYEAIATQTYNNLFKSPIQFPCNFQAPDYDLVAA